ncbi:MAG: hypothetical protein LUD17_08345 [Bacteroidales bacterium]|nr:hypothetical protein [Bacteroidales bacterium]
MNLISRNIVGAVIGAATAFMASATDFHLSDGSILSGYISSQPYASGAKYEIVANQAYIVIPRDSLISEPTLSFTPKASLEAKWVEWADANDAWDLKDNVEGLYLTNVSAKGPYQNLRNVHVMAQGIEYRFVQIEEGKYQIPASKILKQSIAPRSPELLSGVDCTITLRNGNFTKQISGQLIENASGNCYSLLDENGMTQTFKKSDLVKMEMHGINTDQDFPSQCEYKDVIIRKQGSPVTGYITAQDYGQKTVTVFENQSKQTLIRFNEIASFNKEPNTGVYNPLTDVILAEGSVRINDKTVINHLDVEQHGNHLVVMPSDSVYDAHWITIKPEVEAKLVYYANLPKEQKISDIYLIPLTESTAQEIGIVKESDSKGKFLFKKKKNKEEEDSKVYALTYEDMVQKRIAPERTYRSRNDVTRCIYSMPEPGKYAFYNNTTKKALIVQID